MSHQHDPAISTGNLKETMPIIFPATDYDYVDPIFIHHLPPPPPDHYHHHHHHHQHRYVHYYNDEVDKTTAAAVGVGSSLSFWGNDDEKAEGTLESVVDQATGLASTGSVSNITHRDGNINLTSTTWFDYNPQPIITATSNSVDDITTTTTTTTMAVNDVDVVLPFKNQHHHQFVQVPDNSGVVLTNNTHGFEQHHRNGKEKGEKNYAVNNEAAEMDNYVVSFKCKDGWMTVDDNHDNPSQASFLTCTTTSTRSVVPDHHPQREGRKKTKKHTTISSTNKRSKATVLHNKAERKRRDKISQRMDALIPNICYKTDKATMLDQVIEYIKQLQTQQSNEMMMTIRNGMVNNMPYPMMIPMMPYYMCMQQQQQQQQHQQLQMSIMTRAQMAGMGVGGLGSMHTNPIMHPDMSNTGTSRTPAIVHPVSITPTYSHNPSQSNKTS